MGTGREMVVGRHVEQSQEGFIVYWEMPEHFQSER